MEFKVGDRIRTTSNCPYHPGEYRYVTLKNIHVHLDYGGNKMTRKQCEEEPLNVTPLNVTIEEGYNLDTVVVNGKTYKLVEKCEEECDDDLPL